ncbi:MAG TPA: LLM class F420-dependent oxidoreductase [Chloroflexota bacterium]
MIHFGLTLPTYRSYASPRHIMATADRAEELGFHSVWAADHLVISDDLVDKMGSVWFESYTTLAFVAGRTQRLRLGTSIAPVPYRHPLQQAIMVATLDQLSGGRAMYGGAAGYAEGEFRALGLDFHQRGAQTDEYLQAIRIAWTEERPTFHGRFVHFDGVRVEPKPIQRPYPPIWIGGDSEAAFRRVARFGDGWHGQITGRVPTLEALAQRIGRLRAVAGAAGRDGARVRVSIKTGCVIGPRAPGEPERPFHGPVEKVIADVQQASRLGVEELVFSSNVAPGEQRMDTIETLGKEVLPAFARE